jgi:hypothetical protein
VGGRCAEHAAEVAGLVSFRWAGRGAPVVHRDG